MLSINATAGRLDLSPDTVRRLIAAGLLRATRVSPGRIAVSEHELQRYIDAHAVKAPVVTYTRPAAAAPAAA